MTKLFFNYELFNKALKAKKLNANKFAKKINVGYWVVYGWKYFDFLEPIYQKKIEEVLKIKYETVCSDKPQAAIYNAIRKEKLAKYKQVAEEKKAKLANVKLVETNLHAVKWTVLGDTRGGAWLEATQNQPYDGLPLDTVDAPENVYDTEGFALKLIGDSMEPKLPNGAIIKVSPHTQWVNGDICLVVVKGRLSLESCVKQVYKEEKHTILHSINPEYPDITIDNEYVDRIQKVVGFKYEGLL